MLIKLTLEAISGNFFFYGHQIVKQVFPEKKMNKQFKRLWTDLYQIVCTAYMSEYNCFAHVRIHEDGIYISEEYMLKLCKLLFSNALVTRSYLLVFFMRHSEYFYCIMTLFGQWATVGPKDTRTPTVYHTHVNIHIAKGDFMISHSILF